MLCTTSRFASSPFPCTTDIDARAGRNCLAASKPAHVRQGIGAVFAYLHAVALSRIVERCGGAWFLGRLRQEGHPSGATYGAQWMGPAGPREVGNGGNAALAKSSTASLVAKADTTRIDLLFYRVLGAFW
jgi:hypothetical protein